MLYKYREFNSPIFFETRSVRFTQPTSLNDPFELQPRFELLSRQEIEELPVADIEAGSRQLTPEAMRRMLAATLPGLDRITGRLPNTGMYSIDNNSLAQESFSAEIGIFCLSEVPDNLVMWAHYADCYRGYVVGFDDMHEFFQTKTTHRDQVLALNRVIYSDERPALTAATLWSQNIFYRKSMAWSYEREWRIIRPLDAADEIIDAKGDAVALYRIPPEAVRLVVLGPRSSAEHQDLLQSHLNCPEFRHVTIHHARLHEEQFALRPHPPVG
jgi:hypothetical protein